MALRLQVWDRRPRETAEAFEAFVIYRDLGPKRTLPLVAAECGKHVSLIGRWSSRHEWVERVTAFDAEAAARASRISLQDHAEVRARQAEQARIFQDKGKEAMDRLKAGDLSALEAINAWRVGVQEERAALGIPTNVETKNTGGLEIIVRREDRPIRSDDANG